MLPWPMSSFGSFTRRDGPAGAEGPGPGEAAPGTARPMPSWARNGKARRSGLERRALPQSGRRGSNPRQLGRALRGFGAVRSRNVTQTRAPLNEPRVVSRAPCACDGYLLGVKNAVGLYATSAE
jgi:hypothetical protein